MQAIDIPEVPGWTIVRPLGEGGQGRVYKATRIDIPRLEANLLSVLERVASARRLTEWSLRYPLDDQVHKLLESIAAYIEREATDNLGALKVLHGHAAIAAKTLGRVQAELKALEMLHHPNLVRLLDRAPGGEWFVTEFVPGGTLQAPAEGTPAQRVMLLRGDPLAALRYIRPIIDAVTLLHRSQVVHRDIKPANVLLRDDAQPVLADMGLILFQDSAKTRLTDTFESVGTTHWMPPWSHGRRLEEVKPSFDVYGLGKLIWCLVAGERRLVGEGWNEDDNRNLCVLFPTRPEMETINQLLAHTVVANEARCLSNAGALLEEVDKVIITLDRLRYAPGVAGIRKCLMCGQGNYRPSLGDAGGWRRALIRLALGIKLQVYECSLCGVLQVARE